MTSGHYSAISAIVCQVTHLCSHMEQAKQIQQKYLAATGSNVEQQLSCLTVLGSKASKAAISISKHMFRPAAACLSEGA